VLEILNVDISANAAKHESACSTFITSEAEWERTPPPATMTSDPTPDSIAKVDSHPKSETALKYAHQAERLALHATGQADDDLDTHQAVEAKFITAQDPVIETAGGGRLPAVPIEEAVTLNKLKDTLEDRDPSLNAPVKSGTREAKDGTIHGARPSDVASSHQSDDPRASLRDAIPASRTNPLFPPLPMYGPATYMRTLHCWFFRILSFWLSLGFLLILVLGSAATSLPLMFEHIRLRVLLRNPDKRRPFYEEEQRRRKARREAERAWQQKIKEGRTSSPAERESDRGQSDGDFVPTEGGPDPLIDDAAYYARRVGLDMEIFDVQTEDGFIIELWHVYDPREYKPQPAPNRQHHSPHIFHTDSSKDMFGDTEKQYGSGRKKYPVLMMPGLLQSAGAYCCTGEDSFAFYLAKSGYDVWLGNNRCGTNPRHTLLKYGDPRMWAWNIRQMGVMDLPALVSRVLAETGFEKLGLVAHSQGTTQTYVALAKEQRPELGEKISVFCALAPAAYAGPLIGKAYFKFMRLFGPAWFRCIFGIHAFIPFMMQMHRVLPGGLYGAMGYRIFSFLFDWTDTRWEIDFRDRMFQFAPVYVSAESMRWWLGKDCFAKQKCILATREESGMEDEEDEEEDKFIKQYYEHGAQTDTERAGGDHSSQGEVQVEGLPAKLGEEEKGKYAWYNEQFPPLAMWVCGADDLVDGRRLLRRFDRGREPQVQVVHKKIIEGYEHLDCIWAMDSVDKVAKEIKQVIWQTASDAARADCRTPTDCGTSNGDGQAQGNGHARSGKPKSLDLNGRGPGEHHGSPKSPTNIDASAGTWKKQLQEDIAEHRDSDETAGEKS